MEHGRESPDLPQLIQDEDVGDHWSHPHDLWGGAQCLQPLVSEHSYVGLGVRVTLKALLLIITGRSDLAQGFSNRGQTRTTGQCYFVIMEILL